MLHYNKVAVQDVYEEVLRVGSIRIQILELMK